MVVVIERKRLMPERSTFDQQHWKNWKNVCFRQANSVASNALSRRFAHLKVVDANKSVVVVSCSFIQRYLWRQRC